MSSVYGVDASLNHGAVVQLDGDQLGRVDVYVNTGSSYTELGLVVTRLASLVDDDSDVTRVRVGKLIQLQHWFLCAVAQPRVPYAIEDYSYGSPQGAHQLGEVGGIVRIAAHSHFERVRYVPPKTLKMFVTHNGNASKDLMVAAVQERWPLPAWWSKLTKPSREDVCDAMGLAQLLRTELDLRAMDVKERAKVLALLHPKERQVFTKASTKNPTLPLLRPFA